MELLNETQKTEIKHYETAGNALLQKAREFKIVSADDIAEGVEISSQAAKNIKTVKEQLDPIISDANATHKKLTQLRAKLIDPQDEVIKIIKSENSRYFLEQERIRAIEQYKINEATRLQEQKDKEAADKKAMKQMEKGDFDKAKMTLEAAEQLNYIAPSIPETQKSVSTDAGKLNVRKDISVEVVNLIELLKAVINKEVAPIFIDINETKLKRLCKDYGIKSGQYGLKITETFESRITVKK